MAFKDSGRHPKWPKVTDAVIEAKKVIEMSMYFVGMGLTRDSLVSVMYPAGLNSAKSSVTLQRTDRHGILGYKPSDFPVSL